MRATLSVPIALISVVLVLVGLESASATSQLEPRGRILFESCAGECYDSADLYALDMRTGKRTQLTRTPGSEHEPAVSASGVWLAYSRDDKPGAVSQRHQLWLSRTDGLHPVQLTPNGPESRSPAWFMSDFVYFTGEEELGGCTSIFRIPRRGGSAQPVIRQKGDESVFQPSVAADGRLAYGRSACEARDFCCSLEVVDSRGRKTNDLGKLPSLEVPGLPAWSPSGQMIAFETGYDPEVVWVARRDGSHLRRISPRTLSAGRPTWSPDEMWIAFDALGTAARAPYTTDIYVARVDGSDLRRVTRTRKLSESSPAWTR